MQRADDEPETRPVYPLARRRDRSASAPCSTGTGPRSLGPAAALRLLTLTGARLEDSKIGPRTVWRGPQAAQDTGAGTTAIYAHLDDAALRAAAAAAAAGRGGPNRPEGPARPAPLDWMRGTPGASGAAEDGAPPQPRRFDGLVRV